MVEAESPSASPKTKRIGPAHNEPDKPLRSILVVRQPSKLSPAQSVGDLAQADILSASNIAINHISHAVLPTGDHNIVYAVHTFVATLEGQVCVLKGDSLLLLDDTNSYWWLVRCVKTNEVGYIPAENIETTTERLARLNKQRNLKLAAPREDEYQRSPDVFEALMASLEDPKGIDVVRKSDGGSKRRSVVFSSTVTAIQETIEDDSANEYSTDSDSDDSPDSSKTEDIIESEPEEPSKDKSKRGIKSIFKRLRARSFGEFRESIEDIDKDEPVVVYSEDDSRIPEVTRKASRTSLPEEWSADTREQKSKGKRKKSERISNSSSSKNTETEGSSNKKSKISLWKEPRKEERKEEKKEKDGVDNPSKTGGSFKSMTIGRMFAKKVSKIDDLKYTRAPSPSSTTSDTSSLETGPLSVAQDSAESILVLKIFSGNYDFKATYKTVAVNKETTVSQVLKMGLTKFKVPGAVSTKQAQQAGFILPVPNIDPSQAQDRVEFKADDAEISIGDTRGKDESRLGIITGIENNYYLSVVHGDSKERKLNPGDSILDILLKLQSKTVLPGVAPSSQKELLKHMTHVTSKGTVSSIRTPNDSEIKFLINLKTSTDEVEYYDGPTMLVRVYYFGDKSESTTLYTAKTISVTSSATVKDVVTKSIQKFKLNKVVQNDMMEFSLWKAREEVIILTGTDSNPNIAIMKPNENVSMPVKAMKTILKPDTQIPDSLMIRDVVKFIGKTTDNQLAFVLRMNSFKDNINAIPEVSKQQAEELKSAKSEPLMNETSKNDHQKSSHSVAEPLVSENLQLPKIKISNSAKSALLFSKDGSTIFDAGSKDAVEALLNKPLPLNFQAEKMAFEDHVRISTSLPTTPSATTDALPTALAMALDVITSRESLNVRKSASPSSIVSSYVDDAGKRKKSASAPPSPTETSSGSVLKANGAARSFDRSLDTVASTNGSVLEPRVLSEDSVAHAKDPNVIPVLPQDPATVNEDEITYLMAYLGTKVVKKQKRQSVSSMSTNSSSSSSLLNTSRNNSSTVQNADLSNNSISANSRVDKLDVMLRSLEIEQKHSSANSSHTEFGAISVSSNDGSSRTSNESSLSTHEKFRKRQNTLSSLDRYMKPVQKRSSFDTSLFSKELKLSLISTNSSATEFGSVTESQKSAAQLHVVLQEVKENQQSVPEVPKSAEDQISTASIRSAQPPVVLQEVKEKQQAVPEVPKSAEDQISTASIRSAQPPVVLQEVKEKQQAAPDVPKSAKNQPITASISRARQLKAFFETNAADVKLKSSPNSSPKENLKLTGIVEKAKIAFAQKNASSDSLFDFKSEEEMQKEEELQQKVWAYKAKSPAMSSARDLTVIRSQAPPVRVTSSHKKKEPSYIWKSSSSIAISNDLEKIELKSNEQKKEQPNQRKYSKIDL